MQIYPAYTIKKIEDELSWRIVREMMNCWDGEKTSLFLQQRFEALFKKAHNLVIEGEEKVAQMKQMSDQQLLSKLSQMGLL